MLAKKDNCCMDFIKQGTKFILPVLIHYDLDQVRSIEFLFSQNPDRKNTSKGPENVEKFALWDSQNETAEVFREPNENIINIVWTREDTYKFKSKEKFFLDTRITGNDGYDIPTAICPLTMSPTLFLENEELI